MSQFANPSSVYGHYQGGQSSSDAYGQSSSGAYAPSSAAGNAQQETQLYEQAQQPQYYYDENGNVMTYDPSAANSYSMGYDQPEAQQQQPQHQPQQQQYYNPNAQQYYQPPASSDPQTAPNGYPTAGAPSYDSLNANANTASGTSRLDVSSS